MEKHLLIEAIKVGRERIKKERSFKGRSQKMKKLNSIIEYLKRYKVSEKNFGLLKKEAEKTIGECIGIVDQRAREKDSISLTQKGLFE